MKTILGIQHCQSEQHLNGMVGGWTDWPLTPLGVQQAHAIGRALAEELEDPRQFVFLSSDLTRARQTAEIVGEHLGIVPQLTEKLRETKTGAATGQTREWAKAHRLPRPEGVSKVDHRWYENGETMRELYERMGSVVEELLAMDADKILLVSHGNAFGFFVQYFLGIPVESHDTMGFHGAAGGVTLLQVADDGFRSLRRYSDMRYSYVNS